MSLKTLAAPLALAKLSQFDAIIDARTELEHALDHIPGAINWPSLNNQERVTIGTLYKQVNAFEAKKRGAALVARNVAAHIERELLDMPKDWKPLIYCWRGGNRSGALATILGAIGFHVTLLEGGYKAFRQAVLSDLPTLATNFRYRVICGPTGSGKTRLLQSLAAQGAQVLDLEDLANHRSSVLGHIPGVDQPSQKRFDTLVWSALRDFDTQKPIYVESESKKVGDVRVPDALMDAMRASPCIDLQLSDPERVSLLLEDYDFFVKDPVFFCQRLHALAQRRGNLQVAEWIAQVEAGQTPEVVHALLEMHYDPMYAQSMARNFVQFDQAQRCTLTDRSPQALAAVATTLIQEEEASVPPVSVTPPDAGVDEVDASLASGESPS
jgi:tRNA 2-selenouridine synthase